MKENKDAEKNIIVNPDDMYSNEKVKELSDNLT